MRSKFGYWLSAMLLALLTVGGCAAWPPLFGNEPATATPVLGVLAAVEGDWQHLPADLNAPIVRAGHTVPADDLLAQDYDGLVISAAFLKTVETDPVLRAALLRVLDRGSVLVAWGASTSDLAAAFPGLWIPTGESASFTITYSTLIAHAGAYIPGPVIIADAGDYTPPPEFTYQRVVRDIWDMRQALDAASGLPTSAP